MVVLIPPCLFCPGCSTIEFLVVEPKLAAKDGTFGVLRNWTVGWTLGAIVAIVEAQPPTKGLIGVWSLSFITRLRRLPTAAPSGKTIGNDLVVLAKSYKIG